MPLGYTASYFKKEGARPSNNCGAQERRGENDSTQNRARLRLGGLGHILSHSIYSRAQSKEKGEQEMKYDRSTAMFKLSPPWGPS